MKLEPYSYDAQPSWIFDENTRIIADENFERSLQFNDVRSLFAHNELPFRLYHSSPSTVCGGSIVFVCNPQSTAAFHVDREVLIEAPTYEELVLCLERMLNTLKKQNGKLNYGTTVLKPAV